jgi:hypothetical protein
MPMTLRYFNNPTSVQEIDKAQTQGLIPGEFIVFPSAVRVLATLDVKPDILHNMTRDPLIFSTFVHEYQHFLSVLGTTYGNLELFLQLGMTDKFLGNNGFLSSLATSGIRASALELPLCNYFQCDYPWNSSKARECARLIVFANRLLNLFRGIREEENSLTHKRMWPFRGVNPPVKGLYPPQVSIMGPHSNLPSAPLVLGSQLIHEGAARQTEFRVLSDFLHWQQVQKHEFSIREEQPPYQLTRSIVRTWFEVLCRSKAEQWYGWHSLLCDLSLMGPDMYSLTLKHGKTTSLSWEQVHPGWRFWNGALAAVELARDGWTWDYEEFTREQYIRNADALCAKLGWPSYAELLDIADEQRKIFFAMEPKVTPTLSYYAELLAEVWKCKRLYPHKFFNLTADPNTTPDFFEKLGWPRILITKEHVRCQLPVGDVESFWGQAVIWLNMHCLLTEMIYGEALNNGKLQCYQKFFGFTCPQSNSRCGDIPGIATPSDCPFIELMDNLGIQL